MTRTAALADAIAKELAKWEASIDGWDTLRSLTLDVKLKPGSTRIRAILLKPEFETVVIETDDQDRPTSLKIV